MHYDGHWQQGIRQGNCKSYHPNGNKEFVGKWKNNHRSQVKGYDESGNLRSSGK
jgi:antitoxin component YwqK of YwqJK toxin-antitoxin module